MGVRFAGELGLSALKETPRQASPATPLKEGNLDRVFFRSPL